MHKTRTVDFNRYITSVIDDINQRITTRQRVYFRNIILLFVYCDLYKYDICVHNKDNVIYIKTVKNYKMMAKTPKTGWKFKKTIK